MRTGSRWIPLAAASAVALVITGSFASKAASPLPSPSPVASPSPSVAPSPTPPFDLGAFAWFAAVAATADPEDDSEIVCVGRFDGRIFEPIRSDGPIRGAGPRDGHVVLAWQDGEEWVISTADTATGATRELFRLQDRVTGITLGAGNQFYYNVQDGPQRGVWSATASGPASTASPRFIARRTLVGSALMTATDGSAVVITDFDPKTHAISFRVIDTATQDIRRVPGGEASDIVGLLGHEIVVWDQDPMGRSSFPLRAIAPSGRDRTIVDQKGNLAAIFPTIDGHPRLVYEGPDAHGDYTLSAIGPGRSAKPTVIFTGDYGVYEPPVQIVFRGGRQGIEAPGYAPLFPQYRVLLVGDDPAPAHSRLLVSLDGTGDIDLGVQPELPWGSGCGTPAIAVPSPSTVASFAPLASSAPRARTDRSADAVILPGGRTGAVQTSVAGSLSAVVIFSKDCGNGPVSVPHCT